MLSQHDVGATIFLEYAQLFGKNCPSYAYKRLAYEKTCTVFPLKSTPFVGVIFACPVTFIFATNQKSDIS